MTTSNFLNCNGYQLQKTSSKAVFIAAVTHCSLKPFSKAALEMFYKQIEAYHTKSFFFSGAKAFWLKENNETGVMQLLINWITQKEPPQFQLLTSQPFIQTFIVTS